MTRTLYARATAGLLSAALLCSLALAGDSPVDDALQAFRDGKYEQVVELANSVDAEDDARPRADYLIGEAELQRGRAKEAAAAFRRVLEVREEAVPALTGLGTALSMQDDDVAAIETLQRAEELAPKDAQVQRALGDHHLRNDDVKHAVESFARAYKLDPHDARIVRGRVESLLRDDQQKLALKEAKRFRKKHGDHPMGHFLVGLAHDQLGDDDEAIEAYEAAIELDDTFLDAHKNLAIVCTARNPLYQNQERTKKAMQHYERYFELGGDDEQLRGIYNTLESFLSQFTEGDR